MDNILTTLDLPKKVNLNVPLIAAYLNKGAKQTEIAQVCNVTKQSVNDYISRHSEELAPLMNDNLLAMKFRHAVNQGINHQNNILNTDSFTKKDLQTLATITGINFDKSQILQGKATEIVENHDLIMQLKASIKEFKAADEE